MDSESGSTKKPRLTPTRFFLRGLAISLPPILTLVILIWIGRGVNTYIVYPASTTVRYVIAKVIDDSIPVDSESPRLVHLPDGPPLDFIGRDYLVTSDLRDMIPEIEGSLSEWMERRAGNPKPDEVPKVYVPLDRAVPYHVYANVVRRLTPSERPTSATGIYMDYAAQYYFGSQFLLSAAAIMLIVVLLYFLGRFVNVRIGVWMVSKVEDNLLGRLPVIRNVYGSAKQVTDFLFSENQVEYRRVVAIEYPRRGLWSLGLVTGEGMLEITAAVGEPCVSVLVPSSPMPVTGYTMCVPRSSVLDLDITVDQAFQFCISCGVLVPPNQRVTPEVLQRELTRRLTERMREAETDRRPMPSLGVDPPSVTPFPSEPPSPPETGEDPESGQS